MARLSDENISTPLAPVSAHSAEQGSTAFLLALFCIGVIVYASLYPFNEWRDQGISPLHFLFAALPKYWTGFDVGINILGYAPLGFLLALFFMRRFAWPVSLALLTGGLLSLCMESLQSYLPSRVPSNVDLMLNTLGAWLGGCCAWLLQKTGGLDQLKRFRARWFSFDARGALVLLVLWPVALLFPAPVPLGLGQVFERLEVAVAEFLEDTPFLVWMPMRNLDLRPLVPGVELLCVALGALIPCLLAYSVITTVRQRAAFALLMLCAGLAASGLSAALSFGPTHAWAWLDLPVQIGFGLSLLLALLALRLSRRMAVAIALLALVTHLALLNQAPASAYFAQTLQTWEQGRFIRFNGLAQWLGWAWPFLALLYLLARLSRRGSAR